MGVPVEIAMGVSLEITMGVGLEIAMGSQPGRHLGGWVARSGPGGTCIQNHRIFLMFEVVAWRFVSTKRE